MSRMVAVDWDRYEVRCIVARANGARISVQQVTAAPLPESEDAPRPEEIAATVRQVLSAHRRAGSTILVGIDRASVELLFLHLPPATDAELPELVANEALRESQVAEEQAVVDFLAAEGDPSQPRHVTAAVLLPERMRLVQDICSAAGLKPDRLTLRPFAAASLFAHLKAGSPETCLLVNPMAEEVDLTVLKAGRPVFWRTARLPRRADLEQVAERLFAEIHRTLAVAGQEPAEGRIEQVYLFAEEDEHERLRARIGGELALPVECFDPFQGLGVAEDLLPPGHGRFAALLGMLLDEVHGRQHAMDFLHPRRAARPISRFKVAILAAAAVSIATVLGGGLLWRAMSAIDRENAGLTAELNGLTDLVKQYAKQRRLVQSIHDWQAADVNWLEEFRELSERFPPPHDALVLRMSMAGFAGGNGQIAFQGMVRDPSMIVRLEHSLRDEYHAVRTRRIQVGGQPEADYTRLFDATVVATKRDKDQYHAARKDQP